MKFLKHMKEVKIVKISFILVMIGNTTLSGFICKYLHSVIEETISKKVNEDEIRLAKDTNIYKFK